MGGVAAHSVQMGPGPLPDHEMRRLPQKGGSTVKKPTDGERRVGVLSSEPSSMPTPGRPRTASSALRSRTASRKPSQSQSRKPGTYPLLGRRGRKEEARLPTLPTVEHHERRARPFVAPQPIDTANLCSRSPALMPALAAYLPLSLHPRPNHQSRLPLILTADGARGFLRVRCPDTPDGAANSTVSEGRCCRGRCHARPQLSSLHRHRVCASPRAARCSRAVAITTTPGACSHC
jgi:hypothetical protein